MDRTLSFYPFWTAAATIGSMLLLSILNMYILVRHRKQLVTVLFHWASLFLVLGLILHMIGAAVSVLPVSGLYHRLSLTVFLLAGLVSLSVMAVQLMSGRRMGFEALSHSITDALSSISDVVFVVDAAGDIIYINHPDRYMAFFGNIKTMKQLETFLENDFMAHKDNYTFELSPLFAGDTILGYTALLRDITPLRSSESILEAQNRDLIQANNRLAEYIEAVDRLEGEQQRLEILKQVQEILVDDIERALSALNRMKQGAFGDGSYRSEMKALASELRQVYEKVRGTVGKIKGGH